METSSRYLDLLMQMEAVEQQAREAREQARPLVIAQITELMRIYQLTPDDLSRSKARRKKIASESE